jgi:hypothetical protein
MKLNITLTTGLVIAASCFSIGAYGQVKPARTLKKFGKPVTSEVVKCASTEYEALLQKKNPQRLTNQEFENWIAPKVAEIKAKELQKTGLGTDVIVTIPVVFHIIHNGDAVGENENIPDGQVQSQITVLNQDFRKMLGTNGYNDNPIGDDMEIEFCLAQQDPYGLASTGIVRYNLGDDDGWDMTEVEVLKAQTQWDPEKYLNIWVVDYMYGLAGYAQFPTGSGLDGIDGLGQTATANTDGVALGHIYVGSEELYPEGSYDTTRNLGRTASHEVGHFFGLRHIWGDGPGDCTGSDFCDDTPTANYANQGCIAGTDSCEDDPGFDMIENYMDYTDDSCLNIFTQDQKFRMQAVLANSPRRISLITSPGCTPGVTYDNDGSLNIQGIDAVCGGEFTPEVVLKNTGTNTLTSATIAYHIDDNAEATYSWTGSLAQGEETTVTLPGLTASSGEHTLNVALSNVNGGADEIALNDTKSLVYTIPGLFTTTQVVVTIQTDDWGDETIWAIVDADENLVAGNINENNPFNSDFYEDNSLNVITVDIPANGCYSFGIYDFGEDGMCCDYGNGYYKVETPQGVLIAEGGQFTVFETKDFGIDGIMGNEQFTIANGIKLYPNPSNSILNIAMADSAIMPDSYTIYNSLGQVMGTGTITAPVQSLTIANYANGVYFIKLAKGDDATTLQFIKY